ncbi:hypothetical protein AMTRI_Chr02g216450 [Amborella trichopoda]|uniref:Uncharacterized protein n=1 Tax=Amborella trichopoda TaxID=13333 RepID=W1NWZ3_AMBTC|nr:oxygen-evolving enhancer protein 3, chloroplastic [Amborella trichopoda]ERM99863.1 hypothetical protein AMTR_s00098p00157610 [Amborella trichopoda]|eukprot:XP_006837010.1 oxygen-evolving enhancer protein 3, chloroplastic [Amborella trichopoda]
MAHAMASMAGLGGSSQAVLEGSLQLSSGSNRLTSGSNHGATTPARLVVSRQGIRAAQQQLSIETEEAVGRRAMLSFLAAGVASASFVKSALAAVKPIKVGPAPPPSGGLPGTLNSDEPRDLEQPLKTRFYIQPLAPAEAAARAKDSAKDIIGVKQLIDKKAWTYVQMDLRLKAGYLRYDLNTVIAAKPKDEKKPLKELTGKLFSQIDKLDHAAKIKSTPEAEKYYAETVSALNDVLSKLG